MKKGLLISFMVLLCTVAIAQQNGLNNCNALKLSLLQKQGGRTSSTLASRLIAGVFSIYNGTSYAPVDSSTLYYTVRPVGYDTSGLSWQDRGTGYFLWAKSFYTYDFNNNCTSLLQQNTDMISTFVNFYHELNTYDAFHNQLTNIRQYWYAPTSAWGYRHKYIYTYATSTAHEQLTQKRVDWDSASSTWYNVDSQSLIYNSMHQLVYVLDFYGSSLSSIWTPYTKDTLSYDGMGNVTLRELKYWDATSGTWLNNGEKDFYSNYIAPGCNKSLLIQTWDPITSSFKNYAKDTITYNSYNQITYQYQVLWDSSGGIGSWPVNTTSLGQRFYYELYTSTANVKYINTSDMELAIFPNPATDAINLKFNLPISMVTSITLCDVAGRVISVIANKEMNDGPNELQVPTSEIPDGIYFIKLSNAQCNLCRKVLINR